MPLRSIRASACRIDVCLATTNMPRCTAGFAYVTINKKCQSLLCQRHARVVHFEADICIDVTPLINVQICGVDSYKNSSGLQVAHLSQSCVASPNTKRCRFSQSWRGVYTFTSLHIHETNVHWTRHICIAMRPIVGCKPKKNSVLRMWRCGLLVHCSCNTLTSWQSIWSRRSIRVDCVVPVGPWQERRAYWHKTMLMWKYEHQNICSTNHIIYIYKCACLHKIHHFLWLVTMS